MKFANLMNIEIIKSKSIRNYIAYLLQTGSLDILDHFIYQCLAAKDRICMEILQEYARQNRIVKIILNAKRLVLQSRARKHRIAKAAYSRY